MGFFDFLRGPDINKGVEEFRNTEGSVLIDVREDYEYAGGHIPGSINIPLGSIGNIGKYVKDKKTPLFVHCYSGGRSSTAVGRLKSMGYENVKNIGGIGAYKGEVE
ncbi:MAG: rhodanese-like domain-containing protein [Sphaerochaetaceae bacterium]|nr:rhodanese-like domain-containing protein [Sphaerochaetaceae bacterium]